MTVILKNKIINITSIKKKAPQISVLQITNNTLTIQQSHVKTTLKINQNIKALQAYTAMEF